MLAYLVEMTGPLRLLFQGLQDRDAAKSCAGDRHAVGADWVSGADLAVGRFNILFKAHTR